jgi:hypothetical protein
MGHFKFRTFILMYWQVTPHHEWFEVFHECSGRLDIALCHFWINCRRCICLQESAYPSVPSNLKKPPNISSVTSSPLNTEKLHRRYVGTLLQNTASYSVRQFNLVKCCSVIKTVLRLGSVLSSNSCVQCLSACRHRQATAHRAVYTDTPNT